MPEEFAPKPTNFPINFKSQPYENTFEDDIFLTAQEDPSTETLVHSWSDCSLELECIEETLSEKLEPKSIATTSHLTNASNTVIPKLNLINCHAISKNDEVTDPSDNLLSAMNNMRIDSLKHAPHIKNIGAAMSEISKKDVVAHSTDALLLAMKNIHSVCSAHTSHTKTKGVAEKCINLLQKARNKLTKLKQPKISNKKNIIGTLVDPKTCADSEKKNTDHLLMIQQSKDRLSQRRAYKKAHAFSTSPKAWFEHKLHTAKKLVHADVLTNEVVKYDINTAQGVVDQLAGLALLGQSTATAQGVVAYSSEAGQIEGTPGIDSNALGIAGAMIKLADAEANLLKMVLGTVVELTNIYEYIQANREHKNLQKYESQLEPTYSKLADQLQKIVDIQSQTSQEVSGETAKEILTQIKTTLESGTYKNYTDATLFQEIEQSISNGNCDIANIVQTNYRKLAQDIHLQSMIGANKIKDYNWSQFVRSVSLTRYVAGDISAALPFVDIAIPTIGSGAAVGLAAASAGFGAVCGTLSLMLRSYAAYLDIKTIRKYKAVGEKATAYIKHLEDSNNPELLAFAKLIQRKHNLTERYMSLFDNIFNAGGSACIVVLSILSILALAGVVGSGVLAATTPAGAAIAGAIVGVSLGFIGYKVARKIHRMYQKTKWEDTLLHKGTNYETLRLTLSDEEIDEMAYAKCIQNDPKFGIRCIYNLLQLERTHLDQSSAVQDFLNTFGLDDEQLKAIINSRNPATAMKLIAIKTNVR